MRERTGSQQTNRPKMDAGTNPAEAAENCRRAITGKTTTGKTETDLGYHKRMNCVPFPWLLPQALTDSDRAGATGTHGAVGRPAQRQQVKKTMNITNELEQPKAETTFFRP